MRTWIAFWNIMVKDVRTYYLKPPNISWGLIFPLAWTGMFFIKSGSGLEGIPGLLPGVVALSILFGTTSLLAVTVTFEKKYGSFERLLLAPIPFEVLMLSKTGGAIFSGSPMPSCRSSWPLSSRTCRVWLGACSFPRSS